MAKTKVGVVVTEQAYTMTQGKFCFLSWQLQQAGFEVMVLAWDRAVAEKCHERGVPCVLPVVEQVEGVDTIVESQRFSALLDRPIVEASDVPTWGQLLGVDDFLGGCQAWEVRGLEGWVPEVVVRANHGGESGHPQDEQMEVALWRWCERNHIPTIEVEVESLDSPLEITAYPATRTLRQAQLPPAHRHCFRPGQDPQLEQFLAEEREIRARLGLGEGASGIVVPFHLYYMHEFIRTIQDLGEWKQQTGWQGEVFVPVGKDHRRGYTERDMVVAGCQRWWAPLGQVHVVENMPLLVLGLAMDGVLAPTRALHAWRVLEQYGVPVWWGTRDIRLPEWVTVAGMVKEVCSG